MKTSVLHSDVTLIWPPEDPDGLSEGVQNLSDTADIVVIGAGVNGASTAFHLAKRRAGRIVILEQGPVANGATGKSGALVRCHYSNQPETELAFHSLEYFHNWSEMVGGDCGFEQAGLLVLTQP